MTTLENDLRRIDARMATDGFNFDELLREMNQGIEKIRSDESKIDL